MDLAPAAGRHQRPPALRLGDMLLHELESHPEYAWIIRDPGLLRRLSCARIRCCWRKPISAAPSTLRETCTPALGLKAHFGEVFALLARQINPVARRTAAARVRPGRTARESGLARRTSLLPSPFASNRSGPRSPFTTMSNAFVDSGSMPRGSTHVAISRRRMTRVSRLSATSWSTSAASCACSEANACSTSAAAGAQALVCWAVQENMASVRTASRS